jgi:hypothetical protein
LFLNASKIKLISGFETPMQVTTSCGHDHNSLNPFSSVVVTEGHEQLIPFINTNLNGREQDYLVDDDSSMLLRFVASARCRFS